MQTTITMHVPANGRTADDILSAIVCAVEGENATAVDGHAVPHGEEVRVRLTAHVDDAAHSTRVMIAASDAVTLVAP